MDIVGVFATMFDVHVKKIILNGCQSQVYGFCHFGLANYWGGTGRCRMNVIVQLGLAAHKKAPEKKLKVFISFFSKTIYYLNQFSKLRSHKDCPFVFHQPVFRKVKTVLLLCLLRNLMEQMLVVLAGLNSLQQTGYQILLKQWIFDDPIHKKGPLLVILVPGIIQPSGSVIFLMK